MTPEGRVKAAVKKVLKPYIEGKEMWAHWPVQTGYGAPTLDCTGAIRGQAFAIETKRPGEGPTERQKLTIAAMQAAGVTVFVIGTHADVVYHGKRSEFIYSGMESLSAWLLIARLR